MLRATEKHKEGLSELESVCTKKADDFAEKLVVAKRLQPQDSTNYWVEKHPHSNGAIGVVKVSRNVKDGASGCRDFSS